jgi:predicted RNase H-like nuclease (RuvC/YqgF family)
LRGRIAELEFEKEDITEDAQNKIAKLRIDVNQYEMERKFANLRIEELEKENEELGHTENTMITQIQILRDEMTEIRKQLKAANPATVRQHLKSTLLNWFDFMAKSKKEEAVTVCNLLMNQLELQPNEKNDFITALDKLKLKKKTT